MTTQLSPYTVLLLSVLPLAANANIVVDPGFNTGITGTWDTQTRWGGSNLQNGTGVAAAGAFIYDDGWLTFNNGTADVWTVSGGEAMRTANQNRFNSAGIGQIVSNPGAGFGNGAQVEFSFDYDFAPVNNSNVSFSASVYGINAINGTATVWDLNAGNAIESFGLSASFTNSIDVDYTAGSDYQFELIDNFTLTVAGSGGYSSGTVSLSDDYELFAIVFQAADKQSTTSGTSVDNVAFVSIPELSTSAFLAGLAVLGLAFSRRQR